MKWNPFKPINLSTCYYIFVILNIGKGRILGVLRDSIALEYKKLYCFEILKPATDYENFALGNILVIDSGTGTSHTGRIVENLP